MKLKIFGGFAVLAIAAMAAFNMGLGSKTNVISDVMLANVEALAQEPGDGSATCYTEPPYTDYCNIYAKLYYCPCGW